MTSKDKAVVTLPVSPWDAILKAAKDQLPSLDSDSSLVSKSFLLVVSPAWARPASGTPLYRPHFGLWALFSLISAWDYFWVSTSFRPLSGSARTVWILVLCISKATPAVVLTPRWAQFQSVVSPPPTPDPAVVLLSTLLGQVRASSNL